MPPRVAPRRRAAERRLAVIDMGSNTFRLVVFRYRPGGSFQLVDEIRDPVRLSGGARDQGLHPVAVARAGRAAALYRAFCDEAGIDAVEAVTTSAVRDAANRDEVMQALTVDGALEVRVLSAEEEARCGYLGVVNSTTLTDGTVLDLGGGSVQLSRVEGRRLGEVVSRPLGAVRMTERFLARERADRGDRRALRRHVAATLDAAGWQAEPDGRMVGIGGTIRTLASMHQRAARYPLQGELHGYRLPRAGIDDLVRQMMELPVGQRASIAGLKPDRADITLAGAIVIGAIMERAGQDEIEICSQGLREGLFYERFLAPADPPLIEDVRHQSVRNLLDIYRCDVRHAEHVRTLSLAMYDALCREGLHETRPREREVLGAAALLHDAGVLVDYNDHHKHGYYLVLNAGLPGFDHAELAMVALLVRSHRKAQPTTAPLDDLMGPGDEDRLRRLASCLRIAEQLERGRARGIRALDVRAEAEVLRVAVTSAGDPAIALWSAALEAPIVARAFDRRLELEAA